MNTISRARRTALVIAPLVVALSGFGAQTAQAAPLGGSLGAAGPISVSRLAGPALIATVETDDVSKTALAKSGSKKAKKAVAKKAAAKKAVAKTSVAKKAITR